MKTSIKYLPDEVLLKIFRYVPQTCLFQNVTLVNRRFNNITKDPSLLKHLIIRKRVDREVFKSVQASLGRLHLLQKLELPGNLQYYSNELEPTIMILLENCPYLEHIAIVKTECQFSEDIMFLLRSLGKNLHYLDLRKVTIKAEALFHATRMAKLKTLLLGKMCQITVRHFKSIAENCEELETLAIEGTEIRNEAVQYLSKTPNLKTLEMKNVHLFSNVTKDVSFHKLEYVRIENVTVINSDLLPFYQEVEPKIFKDDILKLLANCPKLKQFYMFQDSGLEYGTDMTHEFIEHMIKNYEVDFADFTNCIVRIRSIHY